MRVNIWLDDERPAPPGWLVAKTEREALAFLSAYSGFIDTISLDHDLGDGNGDGYNVACWLEDAHYYGRPTPDTIRIHSANPEGIKRMRLALAKIPGFQP